MKHKDIKYVGLRIHPELHKKLVYVTEYEGRTINGMIIWLLNGYIRQFEKENGPITAEDLEGC